MNTERPHLLIEEGPERGRELVIPKDGARIGRAMENDIVVADASMSRFQCRMYFKEGRLHIMDLGSTNASLVNNTEVSDSPLNLGDSLLIGESTMRVVWAGVDDTAVSSGAANVESKPGSVQFQPAAPEPVAAPVETAAAPASAPLTDDTGSIDLGFGKSGSTLETAPASSAEGQTNASPMSTAVVALCTLLLVIGAGVVFLVATSEEKAKVVERSPGMFKIHFEKVNASADNIFRYALHLQDNILTAEIHDLENQRDIRKQEELTPEEAEELKQHVRDLGGNFYKLQSSPPARVTDRFDSLDMTIVLGRDAHRVRLENKPEPAAFRALRNKLEAFADTRLGLSAMNLPPEVLREQARVAWEVGSDLYARKNVQDDNHWQAIKKMKEVLWLLDTIEPKPDYFRQAGDNFERWKEELETTCDELWFAAQREAQVGNYPQALQYLNRLIAARPDPENELYQKAKRSKIQLEDIVNK